MPASPLNISGLADDLSAELNRICEEAYVAGYVQGATNHGLLGVAIWPGKHTKDAARYFDKWVKEEVERDENSASEKTAADNG